jgi:hypothetical protein
MIDDRLGMVFLVDERTEDDASDDALDGAQAEPAPGERERYGRVNVRAKARGCAQGHAEEDVSHVLGPLRWLVQTHTD